MSNRFNHPAFRLIDPKLKRRLRQAYQNLSLSQKVVDKRPGRLARELPELYRSDGTIDLIRVAVKARRKCQEVGSNES